MELRGIYIERPSWGHTWGLWALNDPIAYDALDRISHVHPFHEKWFRQSDSNIGNTGDKSALFIEFLGQGLNEEQALLQCEEIAKSMGYKLQILQ